MAGLVYVDGQKVTKSGTQVPEGATVEVKGRALPYVSRGGLKLERPWMSLGSILPAWWQWM